MNVKIYKYINVIINVKIYKNVIVNVIFFMLLSDFLRVNSDWVSPVTSLQTVVESLLE